MDIYFGQTNIQAFIYPILNIFAIGLIYAMSYRQGVADGLDKRVWSVTLFMRCLFFIIGCKLFTISITDFFSNQYTSEALLSQRTLAGGILFSLITFTSLLFYFRLPLKVFDYAVVPMLVAVSIQKIGCFFAGCCFGSAHEGPMSVTYPRGSLAYLSHSNHNLIPLGAELPLPVHAVQLYEAFGFAASALLVYGCRNRFSKPGSLILVGSILLVFTRFITNFFRDPVSYIMLGRSPGSLLRMQITLAIILIGLMIMLYVVLWRQKNQTLNTIQNTSRPSWPWLVLACVTLFGTLRWYNAYELFFLLIALLISIRTHRFLFGSPVFIRTAAMIFAVILLSSQKTIPVKKDSVVEQHSVVRVGFSKGSFVNSVTDGDGCDAQTRYFNQKQTTVGVGYGTTKSKQKVTKRGKAYLNSSEVFYYTFFGSQSEQWADQPSHQTNFHVFGGGIQYRYQDRWYGIGAGANVGNLRFAYLNKHDSQTTTLAEKGYWSTPILPSAYLRIGPRHIFFAEYAFAQSFPSPSPSLYSTLMIGSGFGLKNGTELKFGALTGIGGALLSLHLPVGKNFAFDGVYHFGDNHSGYDQSRQQQASLAIEYKFTK